MLITYEKHIRKLERVNNRYLIQGGVSFLPWQPTQEEADNMRKQKDRERRQYRKNRDTFQLFLEELHNDGQLTVASQWKGLYSTISMEPSYKDMLGQPGGCGL